jgi:glycine/D-amino acid oxidase-like deaminating enzyme
MSAPDVVVIGAGIVGAACGYYAARAGLSVTIVDRAGPASGTTGAGEGNILVSDKLPGHDLQLALLSARLWRELAKELVPGRGMAPTPGGVAAGGQGFEYEPKGGLVVAETERERTTLELLAHAQRAQGVTVTTLAGEDLRGLEPHLAPGLAGGAHYPQDAQVQPMLATACLLRAARRYGLTLNTGTEVTGLLRAPRRSRRRGSEQRTPDAMSCAVPGAAADVRDFGRPTDTGRNHVTGDPLSRNRATDGGLKGGRVSGGVPGGSSMLPGGGARNEVMDGDRIVEGESDRVVGVRTVHGDIFAGTVVNAAGTWGQDVAAMAGLRLPVRPRRGFVLVTEPLPITLIRHKVYTAAYADTIASGSSGLETAAVVESTPSGPVLIGSSRERVGFDRTLSLPVLHALAAQAVSLFPVLAEVSAIRAYCGFRPDSPDRMPLLGPDPRMPGLVHACGHEGAGICLAPATGYLIAQYLSGQSPDVDLAPFRPERFDGDGEGDGGDPATVTDPP